MSYNEALSYIHRGWLPIPLAPQSKRPTVKWAHLVDSKPPFEDGLAWPWKANPDLGVAILLKPSGLLVIDADSEEAVQEVIYLTPERCKNVVVTRKGCHLYFRLPEGVPPLRAVQRGVSGKIDILADGYVVAPPSVHPSGFVYAWASQGKLQDAPTWACDLLSTIRERSTASLGVSMEDIAAAPDITIQAMNGLNPIARALAFDGPQAVPGWDRSRAIWLVINTCIRGGYSDESIMKLLMSGALREKPHERGFTWTCDEVARARQELTPTGPANETR